MDFYRSRLLKLGRQTLDLIFPLNCVGCGENIDTSINNGVYCQNCRPDYFKNSWVKCPNCAGILPDLSLIDSDQCYCCSKDGSPMSGIITLGRYHEDQELGKMILAMKHGGKTWFSREFGSQLAHGIQLQFPETTFDGVVAVPLHFRRQWKRGYNQAGLIAGFLAEKLGVKCYEWLLNRCRSTKPQSGGRLDRQANIQNAFSAGGVCKNANIILVDDVVTTGATVRESAETLFNAGARTVTVAACAWVPMGHPVVNRSVKHKASDLEITNDDK